MLNCRGNIDRVSLQSRRTLQLPCRVGQSPSAASHLPSGQESEARGFGDPKLARDMRSNAGSPEPQGLNPLVQIELEDGRTGLSLSVKFTQINERRVRQSASRRFMLSRIRSAPNREAWQEEDVGAGYGQRDQFYWVCLTVLARFSWFFAR